MSARSVALRVAALALLLLLALVGVLASRTLQRLPDTVVYLVRDEGAGFTLEAVHRRLRPADPLDAARAAVGALAAGPTADEAARGLASEVPPATDVLRAFWEAGVLVVDLDADVLAGGGTSSMVGRLAQLTYTLTQPAGVDAVAVWIDGRPAEVWGGEGLMAAWPWRRPAGGLPRW